MRMTMMTTMMMMMTLVILVPVSERSDLWPGVRTNFNSTLYSSHFVHNFTARFDDYDDDSNDDDDGEDQF